MVVRGFFRQLERAPHALLVTDYDGTLAPFVAERHVAYPYPGVTEVLHKLLGCDRCEVVVVSGRPVHEVAGLLSMNPLPELWGAHGWERLTRDGRHIVFPLQDPVRRALLQCRQRLETLGMREAVETKVGALALHWRGTDAEGRARLEATAVPLLQAAACQDGLALRSFDGGLELRAEGRDKGLVVRTLLATQPVGTASAFLGDDDTDEDAFRELRGRGLTVLVRPEPRATAARVWLRPPLDLLEFLERWYEAVTAARRRRG